MTLSYNTQERWDAGVITLQITHRGGNHHGASLYFDIPLEETEALIAQLQKEKALFREKQKRYEDAVAHTRSRPPVIHP